ncbi:MAG: T9SS type A sorting domain-containing protein [Bacteroidales bacterium]|nr:T9SS type A sorting domain-containing protein [Bacteroidales bacterium]
MMKKSSCFFLLMVICSFVFGQATFIVQSVPDYTPVGDPIFVAGSFNGWNPADSNFELIQNESQQWVIEMPQQNQGNTISFKFTRGDWNKVEKGVNGEEIADRQFEYGNGDTVYFDIANWADQGGGGNSTAAENVQILDEAFYMPELNRSRRVWIYLPPDYDQTNSRYPVLYMHDGQNIFDAYTSYVGEWEVDETLNRLYAQGIQVPIVVGIDHGGAERINEYLPWINNQYGGGLGDEYIEFLVQTLKPTIDERFRTLPDKDNTGVMGSSMGGLISQYGALKYQDVFSKAGIFSPAYWISDSVWIFTSQVEKQQNMKFYQMIGGAEGEEYVKGMWNIHDTLAGKGFEENELRSVEIPGGQHTESLWRDHFATAYLWLFDVYANGVREHSNVTVIDVYPNPVSDYIDLSSLKLDQPDTLSVVDMEGVTVLKERAISSNRINIHHLKPGSYLLILHVAEKVYQGKFLKI